MSKRRVYLILIGIIVLASLTGNLAYPNYLNQGIGFINNKLGFRFPYFWDVPFKLGLDLQGGTHLVYEADLSNIEEKDYSSAMQGLRDIIERRVNFFGVAEPIVQTQESSGQHRLVVELAGIKDPAEAIKMIGQTPFLEFKKQRSEEDRQKILDKQKEIEGITPEQFQQVEGWQLAFEDPYFESTFLTGKYLKKAELAFDQQLGTPLILLQFNDEGSSLFEQITSENVGKILAIYIDNVPISTPVVNEKISGGKAQITGDFTLDEAKELVRNLNAGALPVPIKLISEQSVGPILGKISLEQSLKAGVYGFLAILLFMVIFYRLPGFSASLALVIFIFIILSIFKLIPVTLTLAGIAGFILSMGMAVDANILIFARMKEELKEGKSFLISLQEGTKRAWPSIRDGNFTTILVALILFVFGDSFVKGFAFTLIIGNLIGMFSAILVTNILLRFFVGNRIEKIKWLLR
jgi:protein-export membrane protein SecD